MSDRQCCSEFHLISHERVGRYEAIGSPNTFCLDRYNIVSEDELIEASEKVLAFLSEAIKESKIEKLKE
jgi:hypothetical protein